MNQLVGKTKDGSPFLALVLEPGNLHRLQRNEPIRVRVQDHFPDGIPKRLDLLIDYSETPVADAREFAQAAEIAFDERTPVTKQKRAHCPECKSTIEQLAALRNEGAPTVVYCAVCGCVLGILPIGAAEYFEGMRER